MLLQFTVSNFRSFKEPTTISFVKPDRPAANEIYARPEDVLRTVAIYGANASGKSNLVTALEAFRDLVTHGVATDARIPRRPFAFVANDGRSVFELEARVADVQLGYRIELDETRVLAESLVEVLPSGMESVWLDRVEDAVTTGGRLKEREGARLEFIVGHLRANQPALTELRDREVETTRSFTDFIAGLLVQKHGHGDGRLAARYAADATLGSQAVRMLAPFDPGVASMLIADTPNGPAWAGVDPTRHAELDRMGMSVDATRDHIVIMAVLRRGWKSGDRLQVSLRDESDGTRRLLELVVPFADLRTRGGALVIDEIERSLHPLMTRDLVRSWCETPNENGQLIFTTHDTRLLDVLASQPDFHPASIVFTEKGPDLATHFHTLAEYKPEQIGQLKDALETGYLAGRFGAIPVFTRSAPKPDRAAE